MIGIYIDHQAINNNILGRRQNSKKSSYPCFYCSICFSMVNTLCTLTVYTCTVENMENLSIYWILLFTIFLFFLFSGHHHITANIFLWQKIHSKFAWMNLLFACSQVFFYKTSYWAWKMCMYVVCSLLFVVFMVHWILALVHKHTHSSWYIWFMSPNHRLINNVENRDTRLLQPRSAFIWNQKIFFPKFEIQFFCVSFICHFEILWWFFVNQWTNDKFVR